MIRTKDHAIDCMNLMRDNVALNASGPLSVSEADLLALEQREGEVVEGAKRVRYHLSQCEHGDAKTWAAFHELLKYAGIHDQVVPPAEITQPRDYA